MQASTKQTFKAGLKLFILSVIVLKLTDLVNWLLFNQPVNDDLITVMIAYIMVIWCNPELKPYKKDDENDQPKNS